MIMNLLDEENLLYHPVEKINMTEFIYSTSHQKEDLINRYETYYIGILNCILNLPFINIKKNFVYTLTT